MYRLNNSRPVPRLHIEIKNWRLEIEGISRAHGLLSIDIPTKAAETGSKWGRRTYEDVELTLSFELRRLRCLPWVEAILFPFLDQLSGGDLREGEFCCWKGCCLAGVAENLVNGISRSDGCLCSVDGLARRGEDEKQILPGLLSLRCVDGDAFPGRNQDETKIGDHREERDKCASEASCWREGWKLGRVDLFVGQLSASHCDEANARVGAGDV